jgi:hypothetical protein
LTLIVLKTWTVLKLATANTPNENPERGVLQKQIQFVGKTTVTLSIVGTVFCKMLPRSLSREIFAFPIFILSENL